MHYIDTPVSVCFYQCNMIHRPRVLGCVSGSKPVAQPSPLIFMMSVPASSDAPRVCYRPVTNEARSSAIAEIPERSAGQQRICSRFTQTVVVPQSTLQLRRYNEKQIPDP